MVDGRRDLTATVPATTEDKALRIEPREEIAPHRVSKGMSIWCNLVLKAEGVEKRESDVAEVGDVGCVCVRPGGLAFCRSGESEKADEVEAEGREEAGESRRAVLAGEKEDAGSRRQDHTVVVDLGHDLKMARGKESEVQDLAGGKVASDAEEKLVGKLDLWRGKRR